MPDLTSYRKPLRITIDTSLLSIAANSNDTASVFTFIKNSLSVAKQFLKNRISVYPENSIVIPNVCVDLNIIEKNLMSSAPSTDLLIYATSITNETLTYTVTGKSCVYSTNGIPPPGPDYYLQYGRPTVGRMKFNTFPKLKGFQLTNRLFATLTSGVIR